MLNTFSHFSWISISLLLPLVYNNSNNFAVSFISRELQGSNIKNFVP